MDTRVIALWALASAAAGGVVVAFLRWAAGPLSVRDQATLGVAVGPVLGFFTLWVFIHLRGNGRWHMNEDAREVVRSFRLWFLPSIRRALGLIL